jgi:hypothetical protein
MIDECDPELAQLFAKHRRALQGETFAARVVWQIELERKERDWQKAIWMLVALCMAAFASVWIVEGLAFLADELAIGLRAGEASDEQVFQWLTAAMLSAGALGFAALWRLLRSDS